MLAFFVWRSLKPDLTGTLYPKRSKNRPKIVAFDLKLMVDAAEQLRQDLELLRSAVAKAVQETYSLYSAYLETLGRSLKQQLVLTSYHVCTQIYPQQFLKLSLSQRHDLQQSLQQLAQQIQHSVQDCLELIAVAQPESLEALPELMLGQEKLEAAIAELLHKTSRTVNQLLQANGMLPATPLEQVLEIAAKAEAVGRPVTHNPNLLTAVVESEEGDHPPEASVIAMYLQLGEIEFNDSAVMMQRNQIRQLTAQLHKLQTEIAHKQQAQLVTEAAAAWRSTWPDPV